MVSLRKYIKHWRVSLQDCQHLEFCEKKTAFFFTLFSVLEILMKHVPLIYGQEYHKTLDYVDEVFSWEMFY